MAETGTTARKDGQKRGRSAREPKAGRDTRPPTPPDELLSPNMKTMYTQTDLAQFAQAVGRMVMFMAKAGPIGAEAIAEAIEVGVTEKLAKAGGA